MLGARQPSAKRSAALVGDFFASVPEAGLYLLEHILHDWDDAQAVRISDKLPTRDATRRPGYRCRASPRRDWRIRAGSIHRSEHDGDANGPPSVAHEPSVFVQRPECVGGTIEGCAAGGATGNGSATSISTASFDQQERVLVPWTKSWR